ncbi:uncharacterized protein [Zea mays]|uniref:uncharacterized protein isoform X2 n=1 Tax=Zea mays TaxID=4577 RepID=UPI000221236B|nr:uncharacterized protein LOC100273648 isoform X2 [Zea mays]|eukprot:XP_008654586.1 uncharacterized protein LOC100273648 isoform X2 [Zea mays]
MEWSMSRGRRRWRRCGRSMLKLAGLCLAVAVCLCLCLYLCGVRPWACSGCTVLLRSESWRRGRAAAPCGNQGCYTGGQWRRLLADGPGSYPPRCTSKCGDCSPCYPVHVAVPPGVPVTTEYYPEAWRCKCGNRLYMP